MEIRIDAAAFEAKWEQAQRKLPEEIARTMGEAALYVQSQVPGYPPQPPLTSYRRTGTLGRSITTEVRKLGSDTVGVIGTAVVYAPYVIDETRQVSVHRTSGWYTLQAVVRKSLDHVMGMFAEAVVKMLK